MELAEKCSNKDGLCIPEDGLHFVECEMYRMKNPESSLRKKWDEGTRPCSFDEVEDFIRQAISEAEQRGYEKGKAECCVSRLSSINK